MTQILVRLVNCTIEELDEILKRQNLGAFTINELSSKQVQIVFKEQESKEHIMETLDQFTSMIQIDTQETIQLEKNKTPEEEQQQKIKEENDKQKKLDEQEVKIRELTSQMSQLNEQLNKETTEKGFFQKKCEYTESQYAQLEEKHQQLTEENSTHVAKIANLEEENTGLQE